MLNDHLPYVTRDTYQGEIGTDVDETTLSDLGKVYMYVYDVFAASTSEVADHMGGTKAQVRPLLATLEAHGHVCGEEVHDMGGVSVSGPGLGRARLMGGKFIDKTWQAYETYDSQNRHEALTLAATL